MNPNVQHMQHTQQNNMDKRSGLKVNERFAKVQLMARPMRRALVERSVIRSLMAAKEEMKANSEVGE